MLSGWHRGFRTIDLIHLVRRCTSLGLAESKALVERVLAGGTVTLSFEDDEKAEVFRHAVDGTGVRYQWLEGGADPRVPPRDK